MLSLQQHPCSAQQPTSSPPPSPCSPATPLPLSSSRPASNHPSIFSSPHMQTSLNIRSSDAACYEIRNVFFSKNSNISPCSTASSSYAFSFNVSHALPFKNSILLSRKTIWIHQRAPRSRPLAIPASLELGEPHKVHRPWRDGPRGVIWEAQDIAEATGGTVVLEGLPGSISTDTRSLGEGDWFLALAGARFDGHDFLEQALDQGCAGVIANKVPAGWTRGFVQVEGSTLKALQQLGASVRRRYKGPVVAITGSVGKTTTRVMTALALESLGHIHQTEGNLNNHVGVPLTLLKMPSFSAACVLELGMNHKGEITELSSIALPTIRVILNVGPAHLGNFGSLVEIASAKGEIFAATREGDTCVVNADDPLVMGLTLPRGVNVVTFGRKNDCLMKLVAAENTRGGHAVSVVLEHNRDYYFRMDEPRTGPNNTRLCSFPVFKPRDQGHSSQNKSNGITDDFLPVQFEIASPGLHLATNACAAAAIATTTGIPLALAAKSLSKYFPVGMRSRLERMENGMILINDVYNANPMSMDAALRLLKSLNCKGRHVAFLGDMLELGKMTKAAHMEALLLCQELSIDFVGVVGPFFSEAVEALREVSADDGRIITFWDSMSLASCAMPTLETHDVILVKGSRSMKMEIIVDAIKKKECD